MAQSRQCPKCTGRMSEGFVLDHKHGGGTGVANWVEGAPEKSIWTGLKLRGRTKLPIATWRCDRCGFLEQYAQ